VSSDTLYPEIDSSIGVGHRFPECIQTFVHASVFPGRPCLFVTNIITYIFVVEEIREL